MYSTRLVFQVSRDINEDIRAEQFGRAAVPVSNFPSAVVVGDMIIFERHGVSYSKLFTSQAKVIGRIWKGKELIIHLSLDAESFCRRFLKRGAADVARDKSFTSYAMAQQVMELQEHWDLSEGF
jgi:deoxyadenosine/deoxycytidine kinase